MINSLLLGTNNCKPHMIQYALPESANTRVRNSPTILGMVTMKATGNHPFWDVHRESRNFPTWNQCSNMTMVCLQMNPKIYQWQRHLAPTVTAKLLQFSPTLPPIRQQQRFQAVSTFLAAFCGLEMKTPTWYVKLDHLYLRDSGAQSEGSQQGGIGR